MSLSASILHAVTQRSAPASEQDIKDACVLLTNKGYRAPFFVYRTIADEFYVTAVPIENATPTRIIHETQAA